MLRADCQRALSFALAAVTLLTACLALGHSARANTPEVQTDVQPAPAIVTGEVNFELDVMPVLTAAGCNAGACHGKARGQNGFALSLLGFDSAFDFSASLASATVCSFPSWATN